MKLVDPLAQFWAVVDEHLICNAYKKWKHYLYKFYINILKWISDLILKFSIKAGFERSIIGGLGNSEEQVELV